MMDANLSSVNIPESLSDNEEETDCQYQIITNNNEVYDLRDGIVYLSYNKDYITYDSTILETDVSNFEHDTNSTGIVEQVPQDQIIDVTELESILLPDGTKAYLAYNPSDVLNASNIQENTIFLQDYSNIVNEIGENETKHEEVTNLDLDRVQLKNDSVALATTSEDLDETKETVDETRTETVVEKTRRWVCCYEGCEKMYTTLHHLRVHERNHTGSRPFKCEAPGCTKTFATGYSLKTHFRTHSGEKPYACQICSKCFKTSGDLQKHVRTHTGERPFVCGVDGCNMAFTTSNIRKVHMRTHTGERPYRCTYSGCSKAFASATNFRNHQRIHSGEKPYVCPVQDCSKRFTEYSSLYKHQLVHSQVKQNVCNICGKNYRQSSTLRVHKKCVHDVDKSDNIILKDIKQEPYTIIDIDPLEVSVAPNVVNDGVIDDGTQISMNNIIEPSQNIIYVTDNSEKIVKILHTSY